MIAAAAFVRPLKAAQALLKKLPTLAWLSLFLILG